jgi:hypothetical protein
MKGELSYEVSLYVLLCGWISVSKVLSVKDAVALP